MTPLIAALRTLEKTLDVWILIFESLTPEQRAAHAEVFTRNLVWWQEHVWDPLGELLARDD